MKARLPLILTVLGFAGFGLLAVWRLGRITSVEQRALALVFLIGYIAWMAWESRVSAREISKPVEDHDHGTLEVCAAVKFALLLAALIGPAPSLSKELTLAAGLTGIALLFSGAWIRIAAIQAMGAAYSHRIRTPVLPLVTKGPYAWIRHPAYSGTLLIHSGVVCILPNPYSVAALSAWYLAVYVRMRVEERWLTRYDPYNLYRRQIPGALVPRRRYLQTAAAAVTEAGV
jgi:protein-S-isoprenylcysteine O-methyltransferase Ste14